MPTFDASTAECLIFTYKEGLLSAVAHDLKLRVGRFRVEIDGASAVSASFDASSLRVVTAMRGSAESPATLSDKDRRDIEENTAKDVLETKRHKEIRFASTAVERAGDGYRVQGRLTIKGRERPISLQVQREGDRLVGEMTLHQPDFGVKPFSAMLGALRIKPDVRVRVSVPATAMPT